MTEFKLEIGEGSRVPTSHGLFIARCSGLPATRQLSCRSHSTHTALLSHKSLRSANEKHIAESDVIAGHDSPTSRCLRWPPRRYRGLLLIPSRRRRRGGDPGLRLWALRGRMKSPPLARTARGERGENVTTARCRAIPGINPLHPTATGQA